MKRALESVIKKDLQKKMVFIVGPRQVGKTWLAKRIAQSFSSSLYLNYDTLADKKIIEEQSWMLNTQLLILDELHKMPDWKQYLKGVYDGKPETMHILVTGSARMDVYKHVGDSLVGRVFVHHLLPFTMAESEGITLSHHIERGGFPEPFIAKSLEDSKRWRNQYSQGLIQRDVLDFETIHHFRDMQLLVQMLQQRVGSPISYASLSEDLSISSVTVQRYIEILESLYIIFRVHPFSKNIARSLKKSCKIFFFDTGMVEKDKGIRLENEIAVSLKKHVYISNDQTGTQKQLQYIRTKQGQEVDFCIVENMTIERAIEVKLSNSSIDKNLKHFCALYNLSGTQVVQNLQKEYRSTTENITIEKAETFLKNLRG